MRFRQKEPVEIFDPKIVFFYWPYFFFLELGISSPYFFLFEKSIGGAIHLYLGGRLLIYATETQHSYHQQPAVVHWTPFIPYHIPYHAICITISFGTTIPDIIIPFHSEPYPTWSYHILSCNIAGCKNTRMKGSPQSLVHYCTLSLSDNWVSREPPQIANGQYKDYLDW